MLICSLLFFCEHLFTFKLSASMPKISKENFAGLDINELRLGPKSVRKSCLRFFKHSSKALPVYPCGQEHVGMWLKTLHSAFAPQVRGQGSTHLLLEQAWLRRQSELRIHSGRQPLYGSPKSPGRHLHVQRPFFALLVALGPHGLGVQASGLGGTGLSPSN